MEHFYHAFRMLLWHFFVFTHPHLYPSYVKEHFFYFLNFSLFHRRKKFSFGITCLNDDKIHIDIPVEIWQHKYKDMKTFKCQVYTPTGTHSDNRTHSLSFPKPPHSLLSGYFPSKPAPCSFPPSRVIIPASVLCCPMFLFGLAALRCELRVNKDAYWETRTPALKWRCLTQLILALICICRRTYAFKTVSVPTNMVNIGVCSTCDIFRQSNCCSCVIFFFTVLCLWWLLQLAFVVHVCNRVEVDCQLISSDMCPPINGFRAL